MLGIILELRDISEEFLEIDEWIFFWRSFKNLLEYWMLLVVWIVKAVSLDTCGLI